MHLLPPFLTLSVPSPTSSRKRRERERERENCRNRSVPPQTQIKHKYLSIQARRTDKNQAWVCISIRFFLKEKVNIYVDIFSFTPQSYLIFDTSTFQFRIFLAFILILLTILLVDRFYKHICKEASQVFETQDQLVETRVS